MTMAPPSVGVPTVVGRGLTYALQALRRLSKTLAVWDLRASPVAVMLWPREWSLVMVGEKSMSTFTKSFIENALADETGSTKRIKTKSPEIKNLFLDILKEFLCIIFFI